MTTYNKKKQWLYFAVDMPEHLTIYYRAACYEDASAYFEYTHPKCDYSTWSLLFKYNIPGKASIVNVPEKFKAPPSPSAIALAGFANVK